MLQILATLVEEVNKTIDDLPCSHVNVIKNATEQCEFVRFAHDCSYDGFLFNYMDMTFCQFNQIRALSLSILFLMVLVLFISLGIIADEFLCPSLLAISKTFKLPDNIAGVTFLAFGNGANDIFASIGGISHAKPQLIFSGLYGAGIFVTTVVTGSVLLTGDFGVMKRPVVRDLVFYSGAAFLVWLFIYRQVFTLTHAIILVAYYVSYILVIVISRYVYVRMLRVRNKPELAIPSIRIEADVDRKSIKSNFSNGAPSELSRMPSLTSFHSASSLNVPPRERAISYEDEVVLTRFYRRGTLGTPRSRRRKGSHLVHHHLGNTIHRISKAYEADLQLGSVEDVRYRDQKRFSKTNRVTFTNNFGRPRYLTQFSENFSQISNTWLKNEAKNFFIHIFPIDILEWKEFSLAKKVYEVVKAVPYFVMTVTIPVVDLESPNENWCRLLACLNIIIAPQIVLFLYQLEMEINEMFPLWAIVLLASIALALLVFFTSVHDKAPVYHRLFSFVGFGTSVVFINLIANEVIEVMQSVGVVFKLTDSILGLTVLAWGNSLGDLISDLSMARHGYPGMAIAACFGGPMLNLLMGLGVPYLYLFLNGSKKEVKVDYNNMITLLYTTLAVSLCSSLLLFIINRFNSTRLHGVLLIGIYLTYLTMAILIEFKAF